MIAPAVIGLVFGIIDVTMHDTNDSNSDLPGEIIFLLISILIPLYLVMYEQIWIRKEKEYAWNWGTHALLEISQQRPQFIGEFKEDPITGKHKKLRNSAERYRLKQFLSLGVDLLFVGLVLAFLIGMFIFKSTLPQDSLAFTIVGVANAVQIKIFNYLYNHVALYLNNLQNYEYSSQYNDALALKLFLFQFVNSYTSLFYIAFIKTYFEGCVQDNCIDELASQLASIFITHSLLTMVGLLVSTIIKKIQIALGITTMRKLAREKGLIHEITAVESQSKLYEYETPLNDYMEVMISFGYILIFGSSFPLGFPLFLLLLYTEIKVDGIKLCRSTRRPFPHYASSISIWLKIMRSLIVIAIISNTALIIFTTNVFGLETILGKWMTFIIIEHILVSGMYFIDVLIPDTPTIVKNGITWSNHYVEEKLYGRASDSWKINSHNSRFTELKGQQVVTIEGLNSIPDED